MNKLIIKYRWQLTNLLILTGLIFLANRNMVLNLKTLERDSQQSLFLAYHLLIDGFHSMDGVVPSNFREPVISFLNALNIARLGPERNNIEKNDLIYNKDFIIKIVSFNLIYLIVIYLLVYVLARKLSLNPFLSSISSIVSVFFFSVFTVYITSVNSELPSAIFILLYSIFILNFLQTKKITFLILSGLTCGLLVLTKAAFLYIFIIFIPSVIIYDYFISREKIFMKQGYLFFILLSFTLPVGSWILRNYIQLGTTSISDRGGEVLLIRAMKNEMTDEEYWGGYYAYAPEALQTHLFEKLLDYKREDLMDGGSLERLNRNLKSDSIALVENRFEDVKSFYRIAQLEHRGLIKFSNSPKVNVNLDERSKNLALSLIFSSPIKHLRACLLYGWRGLWFYRGRHTLPVVLTFLIYNSLFVVFLLSLVRKYSKHFLISIIPMLYFLFYAFFTHFIPRYSGVLIPILVILMMVLIDFLLVRVKWVKYGA